MEQLKSRAITCCFSGYRPSKLPWGNNEDDPRCIELRDKLRDVLAAVYGAGVRHFICGMALGSDLLFCREVIELRNYRDDVTLEAAIPCETQCINWSEKDRNIYYKLVSQCDVETLLQTAYTEDCMIKRNRYMVNCSSVLIAVFDGSFGGTMQTVGYAKKQGLEIIKLSP